MGLLERLIPLAPTGLACRRRDDLLSLLADDVDDLQLLPLRVYESLVVTAFAQLRIAGHTDSAIAPPRAALGDRVYDTITHLQTLRAHDALDEQLARVSESDPVLRAPLTSQLVRGRVGFW